MTDTRDEAVRLARERICGAVNDGWSIKSDDVAVILDELDRLLAERDVAWQAGAEAMREAAARTADKHPYPAKTAESLWGIERTCIGNAIRVLPLPGQPTNNEENT